MAKIRTEIDNLRRLHKEVEEIQDTFREDLESMLTDLNENLDYFRLEVMELQRLVRETQRQLNSVRDPNSA